ncbi:NPCBM/NEW2 domain-containing protein [Amycolatopsis japonica]|uniref:NPCBM/NEW2 domain-containing protein n=1 Tax=Amycolatopsis japonica TaxID=208439 RepID=UPI003319C203
MNFRRVGGTPGSAPPTRFLPQTLGVVADVAAVSVLIVGGGLPIVWATSLGAVLLGVFAIWRRWGASVDVWLAAGAAVAVAGAGVFGFSLATERNTPDRTPDLAAATSTSPSASSSSASAGAPPKGGVWLIDLPKVEGGYGDWRRGEAIVGGQVFKHSYIGTTCSKSDDGHEVFAIDQRFERFHVTLGIADGAPAETVTRFVVMVDGRALATRDLRAGQVDLLDLPVAKGKRLLLQVDNIDSPCSPTAVWADAVLR